MHSMSGASVFFENRDFEAASPMGYAKMKGYQRVGVRWLLSLAKLGYGGLTGNSVVGISRLAILSVTDSWYFVDVTNY